MSLTFSINGTVHALDAAQVDPTLTLNDFIRRHTSFTGTKLACGEGGCGACAVALARVDPATGQVVNISANSCLRPLASMDGWAVVTTEGLGGSDSGFHPVQERIATLNGSQCGFCTPGMVVTTYAAIKANPGLSVDEMELAFDSNLCRCTGFRPIIDAAKSFCQTNDIEDHVGACGGNAQTLGPYEAQSHDPAFPAELREHATAPSDFSGSGRRWIRCTTQEEVFAACTAAGAGNYKLVNAHTSIGVYKDDVKPTFVDIANVAGLRAVEVTDEGLTVGAGTTFTELVALLKAQIEANAARTGSFGGLVECVNRVAGFHIRNSGTIGGNVTLARTHAFLSDFVPSLMALGASAVVVSAGGTVELPMADFVAAGNFEVGQLLWAIKIPFSQAGDRFAFHKAALRPQFSHALVNAAFNVNIGADGNVTRASIAFGGAAERITAASALETFLVGKPMNQDTLRGAVDVLKGSVTDGMTGDRLKYRQRLVTSFFYKFLIAQLPEGVVSPTVASVPNAVPRTGMHGRQSFATSDEHAPVSAPINKLSAKKQASGEAQFTDDVKMQAGTLFATYHVSSRAKATIESIDTAAAMASPGVVRVLLAADIPNNDCSILPFGPEPVLADGNVISCGQPIALVVADTMRHAETAAALVQVTYGEPDSPALITLDAAKAANAFVPGIENSFSRGDADANLDGAAHRVQGGMAEDDQFVLKEQKHFYLEPQSAYATVDNEGAIEVWSAMQWPGGVNAAVAKATALPFTSVNIRQRRAGGGFGGKLTRAAQHAAACACAAKVMGEPVRLVLNRNLDMAMTGGRHNYQIEYDVAFNDDGKIHALKFETVMDAGCTPDLSFFCCMAMARGTDQTYYVPNYSSHSRCVMTNTLTKTACRGPAEIQASIAMETVIERVAAELNMDPNAVRLANLYPQDQPELCVDPSGQPLTAYSIPQLWTQVTADSNYEARKTAVTAFNAANRWRKRGISLTPVKYEVGNIFQTATVNLYMDGSVLVKHSGCEIGQGLFTKVAQVAAYELGTLLGEALPLSAIQLADTQSHHQPNASFTGGSTGSEGSCEAVRRACAQMVERLRPVVEGMPEEGRTFVGAIQASQAMGSEISLQAIGSYLKHDDGTAHSYHNWGVAVSEVELDVLTGEYSIERVDMLYDCGKSLNPAIDIGQAEGAFVMGLGMIGLEDVVVDEQTGQLLSDGTWEYKLPSVISCPREFNVELLHNASFERGILSSKASGEPPLVLATSVFCAVRQAINAARSDAGATGFYHMGTPATVDRIAEWCCSDEANFTV